MISIRLRKQIRILTFITGQNFMILLNILQNSNGHGSDMWRESRLIHERLD